MVAEVNLQGSYKFGGWYDTSTAPDLVIDINGNPTVLSGQPLLQSRGRYPAKPGRPRSGRGPKQRIQYGVLLHLAAAR